MVDDGLHAATVRFLGDSERVVHRLARDPLMRSADERLRRLLEEADQLGPGPRPFEVGGIGHRSLERVAANGLFPNEVSSGGEEVGPELRVIRPRSREALRQGRRVHLEERAQESGPAVPVAGIADPAEHGDAREEEFRRHLDANKRPDVRLETGREGAMGPTNQPAIPKGNKGASVAMMSGNNHFPGFPAALTEVLAPNRKAKF